MSELKNEIVEMLKLGYGDRYADCVSDGQAATFFWKNPPGKVLGSIRFNILALADRVASGEIKLSDLPEWARKSCITP